MDASFARYCTAVCDQVRFRPDRAAIQSELWGHLEDHAAALEETGLSREEAKARAVEAMGDPVEVGKALDALHSPVAGWLLRVLGWLSNLTLAILCLAVFCVLISDSANWFHNFSIDIRTQTERQVVAHWIDDLEDGPLVAAGATLTTFCPDTAAQTADYDFSVPCAARFVIEGYDPTLYVLLKVVHPLPWLRAPELDNWISAYDDLGNQYPSRNAVLSESQQSQVRFPHVSTSQLSYGRYLSAFVSYYIVRIGGLDPDATRITFTFDRFGQREFLLPISLEGGGPA